MAVIKGYELSNFSCKNIDFKNFALAISDLNIERFVTDIRINVGKNELVFVDDENPISFCDEFFASKSLSIFSRFLHDNRETILKVIVDYLKKYKGNYINLENIEFISDEIIDAILANDNIKKIKLGCADEPFVLTNELYEKFKKANKEKIITVAVAPELAENFDSIIDFNQKRELIDFYDYESLTSRDNIYINSVVRPENFKYFSLMKKDAEVIIKFDECKDFWEIIEYLRKNGFSNKISISISDKNVFNSYLFSNMDSISPGSFENTYVNFIGTISTLKDYCTHEKKLIEMVRPVINLSPFEKYLFIYDMVNKFKKYKENNDDKNSARDLYKILDNEYIVCVGYSNLLHDLLSKVGISCATYGVSIDTGLDYVPLDATMLPDFIASENKIQEVLTTRAGHSRLFVNLVDEKYGLNGYYIADPTWDNDMNEHAFNYSLMTHDEYDTMDRYNYMNLYGIDELFFVHSLEEFYYKLNVMLNKNSKRDVLDYIRMFFDYFKEVDLDFYNELVTKYPDYRMAKYQKDKVMIQDILLDIGEHILSKTNNIVDGQKYREGIRVLLENGVLKLSDGETIDSKVDEIMDYNKNRHMAAFPTRYVIDRNGVELSVINAVNKFDENLNVEHKK